MAYTPNHLQVAHRLHGDSAFVSLKSGHKGLFYESLMFTHMFLTDLEFAATLVKTWGGTEKQAEKLVEVGLWEPIEVGGQVTAYRITDPFRTEYSREDILGRREKERNRKRIERASASNPEQIRSESEPNPNQIGSESGSNPVQIQTPGHTPTSKNANLSGRTNHNVHPAREGEGEREGGGEASAAATTDPSTYPLIPDSTPLQFIEISFNGKDFTVLDEWAADPRKAHCQDHPFGNPKDKPCAPCGEWKRAAQEANKIHTLAAEDRRKQEQLDKRERIEYENNLARKSLKNRRPWREIAQAAKKDAAA